MNHKLWFMTKIIQLMDDVPQLSEHMRLLKVEDALKLATQFFEERILKLGLFSASLINRGC